MHEKTIKKITKEIRGLVDVSEVSFNKFNKRLRTPLPPDRLSQKKYLAGEQKSLSTNRIFIEHDDLLLIVKLKKTIYSNSFIIFRNKLQNIIIQHENAFNATHDKLTEIYNRNGFETEIKKHKTDKYLTICIADIDNFKQINDSHSHDFGDKVLQEFSNKLKAACQASLADEIIFSRYGGEEFVIAIISNSLDTSIPEEIRYQTKGTLDQVEYKCSLGFSHTTSPQKISMPLVRKLYKEADAALYKSKREGKNRSTNFEEIRKTLGKILEVDESHDVITIDIGKNTGVILSDHFIVYPPKYSGRQKFIIDDGRSQKPIGIYPKIKAGEISPFDIQDEISFCRLVSGEYKKLETGSCLELLTEEE